MLGSIETKKIIIITKYFVPHNVVDSNAVYDLILDLLSIDNSLQINVVTTGNKYKSDVSLRNFDTEILRKISIHKIKQIRFPFLKSIRPLNDFIDGFLLTKYAKKLKINTVISLSNPPLISMWSSIVLKKRNFIYWSFDLYPEALVSSRLIKKNSLIYKLIHYITYLNKPHAIISMGPKQFEYLNHKYSKANITEREIIEINLPCGIHNQEISEEVPKWRSDDRIIIGYIGNLGKAHSKEFLINIITNIANYENLKLVLSLYGEHANEIFDIIKSSDKANNIELIPSVHQNQLAYIDVHIFSLLNEWTNVSVPSKAVSAICSNSVLWYSGSKDSDSYNYFKDCLFYSQGDNNSVCETLMQITKSNLLCKKKSSELISQNLQNLKESSIKKILQII